MNFAAPSFAVPLLLLASTSVVTGQTTWDFGASPDQTWSNFDNWDTGLSPAGTAVVFGATGTTANATTVGNIVDEDVTVSSLTYNPKGASSWQVTEIASGVTLTVEGLLRVGGYTENNVQTKAAITGAGALVLDDDTASFVIGNNRTGSGGAPNTAAILDLSGLSSFTATVNSFGVGNSGNSATGTLYLANESTITANTLTIGGGTQNYGGSGTVSNKLYLGTTTVWNATTIALASARTAGLVKFREAGDGAANNTTVSDATLTIRGTSGGTTRANVTVGDLGGGSAATNGESVVDLTGGTVDALINTLVVGASPASLSGNYRAILSLGAGTVDATTVTVGRTTGSDAGGGSLTGTLNLNGGEFTAGTLILANNQGGSRATNGILNVAGSLAEVNVTGDLTTGTRSGAVVTATVNISGGTVTVGGNVSEGSGAGAGITSTINLSGGTLDVAGNVTVDTFNLTGGSLKNTTALTVGTLAYASGAFDNVAATTINTALTFNTSLGEAFTALALTGTLTLGAGADLSLALAADFTPVSGFTLVSNDGSDSITGTFATINGGAFGAGNTFTLTNNTGSYDFTLLYNGGDGNDLVATLSMVPEPSVCALLLGVVSLGVIALRRNRRIAV